MTILAGHGKDDRLIQVELPIVPNVGDRIRENLNPKDGSYHLDSLISEGVFTGLNNNGAWKLELNSGKFSVCNPDDCQIIDRAPVLVEKEVSKSLPEQGFKVGDRVYQDNPDNIGIITTISRGKALVNVGGDRQAKVSIEKLHHCDPNYSPKSKKSEEELLAEEEAAIAKAREEYLKSQIELPFDCEIPDNEKGNECYTPAYVLDLCRDFLAGFDLDAFSNAIAQRTVRAETFWTKEDNALSKDWSRFKRKWCNPPYRKLASDGIIDKILSYIHIGETLLLMNSSTSAKWFHKCMDACTAYVHPSKRIGFYNPYSELEYLAGKPRSSNNFDQTIFYFGDRPLEFAEALSSLGNAVQPIRKAVLVESKSVDNSLPEQDLPISISGEAILGITANFKPVEIAKDPVIDKSYIDGFNVGDRIRFRDGYKTNLRYELTIGIITDIDDINIKVIWDGETDSDGYTKFHITNKQWWEKVDPVSNIDAAELPLFEVAIATEPSKSVANLRMDEGSVSVLVERNDRYQFLLERREQLINSGACADGIWINCGQVSGKKFKQAVWKCTTQRPEWDGNKSKYIGEFGKEAHISAIAQHRAGQELRKVEREILKLQVKS